MFFMLVEAPGTSEINTQHTTRAAFYTANIRIKYRTILLIYHSLIILELILILVQQMP